MKEYRWDVLLSPIYAGRLVTKVSICASGPRNAIAFLGSNVTVEGLMLQGENVCELTVTISLRTEATSRMSSIPWRWSCSLNDYLTFFEHGCKRGQERESSLMMPWMIIVRERYLIKKTRDIILHNASDWKSQTKPNWASPTRIDSLGKTNNYVAGTQVLNLPWARGNSNTQILECPIHATALTWISPQNLTLSTRLQEP